MIRPDQNDGSEIGGTLEVTVTFHVTGLKSELTLYLAMDLNLGL